MAQGFLGSFALRDVANETCKDRLPFDQDTCDGQFHRKFRGVGAQGGQFNPRAQKTAFARGEVMSDALAILFTQRGRNDQISHLPAQHVSAAVTERVFRRAVPLKNPPFVVNRNDGIERGIQDRVFPRLIFALHLLNLLTLPAELRRPQLAFDDRDQTRQIVFEDVILRAGVEHRHRVFVLDCSRQDDKGKVRSSLFHQRQSVLDAESGHRIVREGDIPGPLRERSAQRFDRVHPFPV